MHAAYISLGANLGDRRGNLIAALEGLAKIGRLRAVSSLYATAPVDFLAQPEFYNAAAQLEVEQAPRRLLDDLLALESSMGRQRLVDKGPRTLDLDLLFYDDLRLDEEGLTLPHPRLQARRFVLTPLSEIAPELRHPTLGGSMQFLLKKLPPAADDSVVRLRDEQWSEACRRLLRT